MPDSVSIIDTLRAWLTYDRVSGALTWRRGQRAGRRAGCVNKHGYIVVRVQGQLYYAHQIAFAIVRGFIPPRVDHRDGDPSNNRWKNLRRCTQPQNMQNQRCRRDSQSGLKGAFRRSPTSFYSRIKVGDRLIPLGSYSTAEAAHAAYVAAARKYFGEFARHA